MKILSNKQYRLLMDTITLSQNTADDMVKNFNQLSEYNKDITKSRDSCLETIENLVKEINSYKREIQLQNTSLDHYKELFKRSEIDFNKIRIAFNKLKKKHPQ